MATVAESLIITLGLDIKGVQKGGQGTEAALKKVENQASKTEKQLETTAKRGKEMFSALEAGILSLVAAVGAARVVKDFFQDAIVGMADLGRKSEYLHTSASTLQAWGNVAEAMGGTAAEAGASLQSLASDMVNLKFTGQSAFAPVLNRLGIDMRQFKDSADPLSTLVLSLADKFKQLIPQEALFFGKKLGLSDSLITALRQGRASVEGLLEAFKKASGATDESTRAAQKAQLAWQLIKARFAGVRDEIEGRLTPVVQKLLEQFAEWIDRNRNLITSRLIEWVQSFATWLKSIDWNAIGRGITQFLKIILDLVSALGRGVDAIGGWKNALIGIGAIMTLNLLKPLTGIVGMLGRMIPLLSSARAGVLGLTAVAAYWVGSKIGEKLEGTKAGAWIGRGLTNTLAMLGSDEAKQAAEVSLYAGGSDKDRGQLKARYLMMSAKQKAQYEKDHPGLAGQIKAGLASDKLGGMNDLQKQRLYSAQHSRLFGSTKDLFRAAEAHEGLPAGTLDAYYAQESSRGRRLNSPAGAAGPFQFMPGTAKEYGLQGEDVYDLDKSAAAAARKIAGLLKRYKGNMSLAAAAYNAGEGNVAKYGGIPPFAETQNYVRQINARIGQASQGGMNDYSRSSEVSIGTIQVNAPQATDARGIAMHIGGELQRNKMLAQATTGIR